MADLLAHDLHGLGEKVVGPLVVIGVAALDALGLQFGNLCLVGIAETCGGLCGSQGLESIFARRRGARTQTKSDW